MSLCSYPTNWLVSTIVPDYHACILQLHLTSNHVFISCILLARMSVTVSSYQDVCILHLHPTISHVCNNCIQPFLISLTVAFSQQSYLYICAYKHACLIHLHGTSIHISYSNMQPSVLHLQQNRDVVMVVRIALGKQARTNQQSRWLRACRYLTQGCFLCIYTTLRRYFLFVNFIHPSS